MNKIALTIFLFLIVVATGCKKGNEAGSNDSSSDFNFYQLNVYLSSPVYLDANVPTGASFDWDYGDGSPHGTTASVNHSYSKAGVYIITLKVGKSSTSKKIRVYPGQFSYQIKNSLDRNYSNYQSRITDATNTTVYFLNGTLIIGGSITDTIFVSLNTTRNTNAIYVDGNLNSDKGNNLRFGIGNNFEYGKHTVIDITPATNALFYQTSGSIALPPSGITIATGIANY